MRKWLSEELDDIPCDFCGCQNAAAKFTRADGMQVEECTICGLAYINPRPKPEYISQLYEADYFTGASALRGEGGLKCNTEEVSSNHNLKKTNINPRPVAIINERFGGFKDKKILEIGCATGDLLWEMQKIAAAVKGIEISDFAASIARKRSLNVATGSIEDYIAENSEDYDIVMAFEVIEHVLSPTRFFSQVANLVCRGGLLMLSTPNYACSYRFGDKWYGFNASFEHLFFYSLEVLSRFAYRAGFALRYWETSMDSGGPNRSLDFVERQMSRLYKIAISTKEIGLKKTTALAWNRSLNFQPYGHGHTLVVVFEKNVPD